MILFDASNLLIGVSLLSTRLFETEYFFDLRAPPPVIEPPGFTISPSKVTIRVRYLIARANSFACFK